jgi:hypothetical protein
MDVYKIPYRVGSFKEVGLEAKWAKSPAGGPYIKARKPDGCWYVVSKVMFDRIQKVGVLEGFDEHTLLGDIFSVKV